MKALAAAGFIGMQILIGVPFLAADPVTTTFTTDGPRFLRMEESGLLDLLKSSNKSDREIAVAEIRRRGLVRHLAAAQALLSDPEVRVRAEAAATTFSFGDESVAPILRQMLEDADAWVASRVAAPLVAARDMRAMEVARKLTKHPDLPVRTNAFEALWSSPDEEVSYAAIAAALGDHSIGVRTNAVRALAKRHTGRALKMLVTHLPLSPGEFGERWEVAVAIAQNDTWGSVPVLIELVTDPDPRVARQAFYKLAEVHPPAAGARSALETADGARSVAGEWRRWWDHQKGLHKTEERLPRPRAG